MPSTQQEAPAATQQEAPVQTGLQAEAEAPANDAPINIAGLDYQPKTPTFEMVMSDQRPEGFVDPQASPAPSNTPTNYHDSEVLRKEKEREAIQGKALRARLLGTLHRNIQEARNPEPPAKQPLPPHLAEQTRLELEAGRAANAHHASVHSIPPRRIDPRDGSMVPVFRPADFVPKMDKSPLERHDAEVSKNV